MVTCCRRGSNGFTLQLYGLGWGLGCSLFCMRDFSGESTILRKHHFIWWKDRLLSFFHSVCSQSTEGKLQLFKRVKNVKASTRACCLRHTKHPERLSLIVWTSLRQKAGHYSKHMLLNLKSVPICYCAASYCLGQLL